MAKNENSPIKLIYLILIAVAAIVLVRFLIVFHWVILSAFIVTSVGFGLYFLWKYFEKRKNNKAWEKSIEGIIEGRSFHCQDQLLKNEKEINEIEKNMKELKEELVKPYNIDPKAKAETTLLINAFKEEKQIRVVKIEFYESAIKRLKTILHNHKLNQQLAEKRENLKLLQERNYDEIADLEELKSNIEYDKMYLETIDTLANRLQKSQSLKDVQNLRLELEKMTREMDEL